VTLQRYVSDELTHLTGRGKTDEDAYGALLSILRSGTLRHSGEALPHGTFPDNPLGGSVTWNPAADLIAHEMFKADIVCFCDIPVPDLAFHARKYSRFGLAFPKTFLLAKGATPVFYVASDAVNSGEGTLAELFAVEIQRFHRRSFSPRPSPRGPTTPPAWSAGVGPAGLARIGRASARAFAATFRLAARRRFVSERRSRARRDGLRACCRFTRPSVPRL
jgi:hypothetical protein